MVFYSRFQFITLILVILAFISTGDRARAAVFVHDGKLIITDDAGTSTSPLIKRRGDSVPDHSYQVADHWGNVNNNQFVITLKGEEARKLAEKQDHHCSDHSKGLSAWLVSPEGLLETLLCDNVLRAFPGPGSSGIALISPDRDLSLWKDNAQTSITAPGKVSNVGWSPDGRYLVASVYPPDWSEGAVSSASTTDDFLRLQNADLYLFDVQQMAFITRLTDDPGTEYGAFFSPDGASLYYTWLHLTQDEGGLMRLDLDKDAGTSATAPAVKLTNAGNDVGETPLGRVGTYLWQQGNTRLVFESGLPDGSGEIWVMTAQGKENRRAGAGRKPQYTSRNSVSFITSDGKIEFLSAEELQ